MANLQVSYETSESLRKHAELQRNFYLILGRMFLKVVGLKADRVRNTTTNMNVSSPNAQLKRIREGLDPDRQALKLIVTLYDIYAQRLGNVENDLRVAYFQLGEDGYLTPIHAWNGVSEDCITLPAGGLREKFKVDQTAHAGSLVASVAKTGLMIIVPDAEKADADANHPFKYLTEQQRATIKSIACIPLRRADEDVPIRHVISLDSDKRDFFAANADTETEMKEISRHLAFRLLFEGDMQELFERVLGGPDAEIQ